MAELSQTILELYLIPNDRFGSYKSNLSDAVYFPKVSWNMRNAIAEANSDPPENAKVLFDNLKDNIAKYEFTDGSQSEDDWEKFQFV